MNNMHIDETFAGTSKLVVGNGAGLCITHLGHAFLRLHDYNTNASSTLKLNNILLVPQITKNLISISQLTKDNNVTVEFTDKFYFVKDKVKKLIILQGKADKGLYRLLLVSSNKTHSQNHVTNVEYDVLVAPLLMFSVISSDLQNKTSCTDSVCTDSICLLSAYVLHQRLGHPNSNILSHVIKTNPTLKAINENKSY